MARPNHPWYRKSRDCWYVKIDGSLHSLGVKGRSNESAAWVKFKELLDTNSDRTISPIIDSGPLSVSSAIQQFLAACKLSLKPKTVIRYEYDTAKFAAAVGQDFPITKITPDHIRQWLSKIEGASTTRAIMLRSVSAMFGWLVKEDKLLANPVKKVTRPRTNSKSDAVLITDDQHQQLLAVATPEFRSVLTVLHDTGCRPGELNQITAENFNADAQAVVITVHKTDRTGKPRILFLTENCCELLKTLKEQHPTGPLLRSNKKVPWNARSVLQGFRLLREKTGIKVIAYSYRHKYINDGLKKGLSNAVMASLAGHTSTAVIDKHYSHLGSAAEQLKAAVQQFRTDTKKPPTTAAEGESN